MMAKPMKTLELHYPMIQFLIILIISRSVKTISIVSVVDDKKNALTRTHHRLIIDWVREKEQGTNQHTGLCFREAEDQTGDKVRVIPC